jgi:hypothetical protein
MKVPTCRCCGHPILSDEIGVVLTPLQRRIFNVVKRAGTAGISGGDIMDEVYANVRGGGPDSTNIIAVVANHANKRLSQFNIKIQGKRGVGGRFTIEKIGKKSTHTERGEHERATSVGT